MRSTSCGVAQLLGEGPSTTSAILFEQQSRRHAASRSSICPPAGTPPTTAGSREPIATRPGRCHFQQRLDTHLASSGCVSLRLCVLMPMMRVGQQRRVLMTRVGPASLSQHHGCPCSPLARERPDPRRSAPHERDSSPDAPRRASSRRRRGPRAAPGATARGSGPSRVMRVNGPIAESRARPVMV